MNDNNSHSENVETKWLHPNEVLKLQRLKLKKKQLQARIKPNQNSSQDNTNKQAFQGFGTSASKRTNPFVKNSENKRFRTNSIENEESSDQTLFKLLHLSETNSSASNINQPITFTNVLTSLQEPEEKSKVTDVGKPWIPIDWALKSKVRLMSSKAFVWNQKLKVSEEASGITAFVRCLDKNSETTVDTSPNAKFHQCCLYWQFPFLPWLSLFPRSISNTSKGTTGIASASTVRESLQRSWSDSLRSLFQLVRTRQCPYFYVCANNFTVIFRAAGICGYTEMNAIITPTTRGFRQLLKQEDIDFIMPLKSGRRSDQMHENSNGTTESIAAEEDEAGDEEWLQSMGINAEDIKQINYTQARISQKNECEIDNSEQSLVFIEGMEVNGLYNFLLNTKITINTTGPLAGIPPTLLSQVAFQGGTLCALRVKESKVRVDEVNYFSLEISGPVLPHLIHNLCALHPVDQNLISTFANLNSTVAFNKVKVVNENGQKENQVTSGFNVFGEMNLADCGLNSTILKHFCSPNVEHICNIESLKYDVETKTYTWS